jgi:DNA polymerase elongation subunit (family B)
LDFSFKEELIIKSGLFIDSKKKYAIWVKKKEGKPIDKIEVVGIEVVRSDYPQFSRTLLSELIHMILKDKASKAKISSFVVKKISEYKKILKARCLALLIGPGVPSYGIAGKIINIDLRLRECSYTML